MRLDRRPQRPRIRAAPGFARARRRPRAARRDPGARRYTGPRARHRRAPRRHTSPPGREPCGQARARESSAASRQRRTTRCRPSVRASAAFQSRGARVAATPVSLCVCERLADSVAAGCEVDVPHDRRRAVTEVAPVQPDQDVLRHTATVFLGVRAHIRAPTRPRSVLLRAPDRSRRGCRARRGNGSSGRLKPDRNP